MSKIIMLVLGLEKVALRKESVDRNRVLALAAWAALGRSPQGERG